MDWYRFHTNKFLILSLLLMENLLGIYISLPLTKSSFRTSKSSLKSMITTAGAHVTLVTPPVQ